MMHGVGTAIARGCTVQTKRTNPHPDEDAGRKDRKAQFQMSLISHFIEQPRNCASFSLHIIQDKFPFAFHFLLLLFTAKIILIGGFIIPILQGLNENLFAHPLDLSPNVTSSRKPSLIACSKSCHPVIYQSLAPCMFPSFSSWCLSQFVYLIICALLH